MARNSSRLLLYVHPGGRLLLAYVARGRVLTRFVWLNRPTWCSQQSFVVIVEWSLIAKSPKGPAEPLRRLGHCPWQAGAPSFAAKFKSLVATVLGSDPAPLVSPIPGWCGQRQAPAAARPKLSVLRRVGIGTRSTCTL